MVTCGPTWVPIDDTRLISNISSGRLGHAVAQALVKEKANVTLLEGPVIEPLKTQAKLKIKKYRYYNELRTLLFQEMKNEYFAIIHAAAVSDYQLKKTFSQKLSSERKSLKLLLVRTEKLINRLKKINKNAILVGFKLKSRINKRLSVQSAKQLIEENGCDFVVVNENRDGQYKGFLIDRQFKILKQKNSRESMATSIVGALKNVQ